MYSIQRSGHRKNARGCIEPIFTRKEAIRSTKVPQKCEGGGANSLIHLGKAGVRTYEEFDNHPKTWPYPGESLRESNKNKRGECNPK